MVTTIGRGVLEGLVVLLLAGSFLFPYVGGAATAYALILVSLALIVWNFVRPPRLAPDPGAWLFLVAWVLIAIAYALTNRPGSVDFLLSVNFALFALFPLLNATLQRFARRENLERVATLALAGTFIACGIAAFQVFGQHMGRAAGYGSNPIPSATAALFLGFFALAGLFATTQPWRYVFVLGPVVGIAIVLLAGSRGPLLALPLLVLIALFMLPIRRILVVGALVVMVIAAGGLYAAKPSIYGRIHTLPVIMTDLLSGHAIPKSTDKSANTRYAILVGSIEAFRRAPWLGYGWYMKTPVVAQYTPWDVGFGSPRTAHLHSDILNFGVSAGVVGLVAYLLALLAPVVSAATSPRDSQYKGRLFLAISLSAGFLCCGAVNLLFGFEFMTTMYVCWAAIFSGYCRDAPALAGAA